MYPQDSPFYDTGSLNNGVEDPLESFNVFSRIVLSYLGFTQACNLLKDQLLCPDVSIPIQMKKLHFIQVLKASLWDLPWISSPARYKLIAAE